MGIVVVPAASSPIKSLQRGVAVASGSITITSVTTSKTIVKSFSNGSDGTVSMAGANTAGTNITISGASTGAANGTSSNRSSGLGGTGGSIMGGGASSSYHYFYGSNINGENWTVNATALAGGSTNIVSKQFGAYLADSTTIVVNGPCRYEVVEYY